MSQMRILEIELSQDILLPYLTTVNVVGIPVTVTVTDAVIAALACSIGGHQSGLREEVRVRLSGALATILPRQVPPPEVDPVPSIAFSQLPANVDVDSDVDSEGFQQEVTITLSDDDGSGYGNVILQNLTNGSMASGFFADGTWTGTITLNASSDPGSSNELRATCTNESGGGLVCTGSVFAVIA